jgi:hypothetical protein
MGIVPQHLRTDVTDHRLYDSDGNTQFDHMGDKGVPQIVKPETFQSGGLRKAFPGTIPVFLRLMGIVTTLALTDPWASENE